ncbi:MAG: amino acid adenylation domain-containing protein [Pseudomonadota bacterium]
MNNIARYLHAAARRHPERVAVKCEGRALSYTEFDRLIDRMRRFIRDSLGHKPEGIAAVLAYKSIEAVAFAQAALRCGLAYTVIDPRYPDQRIGEILQDSRPAVLFTDFTGARLRDVLQGAPVPATIFTDTAEAAPARRDTVASVASVQALEPLDEPPADKDRDDIAYVLYTSGSTGVPKGVRISHRSAGFSIDWAQDAFGFETDEVFLNQAHFGFDFCVLDHYNAWNVGAVTILVPEYNSVFPVHVVDIIREERVTNVWLVPSNIVALVKQGGLLGTDSTAIRRFLYGGEPFQMPWLREVHAWMGGRPVYNLYGPTETNLITAHRVTEGDLKGDEVPLGPGVPGVVLKVLDEDGKLSATGTGDLCCAGDCIASGYTNRPDLNESRYLHMEGRTWYRTGDIVQIEADGTCWYRGRVDDMVKVRGFRIELKEVERALTAIPGIGQAALLVYAAAEGDKEIHAFCVAAEPDERGIRRHLAKKLPPFMVPKCFHFVPDIPYNDRGKVNRGALQALLQP